MQPPFLSPLARIAEHRAPVTGMSTLLSPTPFALVQSPTDGGVPDRGYGRSEAGT